MLTVPPTHRDRKGARQSRRRRRDARTQDDPGYVAFSRDDRLIWLVIALVAGIDGGLVAGLLTTVAGGSKHMALGAGGAAALGTFGAVLTAVRFLHNSSKE